jgi:hypothetical protein
MTDSCVVNRRPHSGQDLRRRIAVPSSATLLSITRLSGWRQNGQYTRSPPGVLVQTLSDHDIHKF